MKRPAKYFVLACYISLDERACPLPPPLPPYRIVPSRAGINIARLNSRARIRVTALKRKKYTYNATLLSKNVFLLIETWGRYQTVKLTSWKSRVPISSFHLIVSSYTSAVAAAATVSWWLITFSYVRIANNKNKNRKITKL